ncbi:hypothetical protein NG895_15840 [Aeoliella sp. ICT_H6.2]|uniref:Uncharacterized protein n=1 Tax=Aeoliella straminimaris TaxID=2954799 RepID=A0A9X2FGT6_9BACT|nr:hypothetical protein [Aeoliella straminimaris]MCO6045381.1 hypothetical protein [Aeoliella straminimaris]
MNILARTLALSLVSLAAVPAAAQQFGDAISSESQMVEESSSWYGENTSPQPVTPRMIIQQKAQMRAFQRMARMESMKWYGMSASRPLANAVPFSGVPSPRYQMPGGRPFAWYPYPSSTVVITR